MYPDMPHAQGRDRIQGRTGRFSKARVGTGTADCRKRAVYAHLNSNHSGAAMPGGPGFRGSAPVPPYPYLRIRSSQQTPTTSIMAGTATLQYRPQLTL